MLILAMLFRGCPTLQKLMLKMTALNSVEPTLKCLLGWTYDRCFKRSFFWNINASATDMICEISQLLETAILRNNRTTLGLICYSVAIKNMNLLQMFLKKLFWKYASLCHRYFLWNFQVVQRSYSEK